MIKINRSLSLSFILMLSLSMFSCKKGGINIFTLEDDKQLGLQVSEQIASNPSEFPILSESAYPEAYAHINRIMNAVLNSGEVNYRDEFDWQVKIIHDDNTLNAFAAPGGYMYFYTGLIKFLDTEDQFAGVMAHEIAHADRRHSTQQLTRQYGVSTLLGVVLGEDPGLLAEIAAGLVFLRFSRNHERDADKHSVIYLCPTDYNSAGAAGFFQKIESSNSTSPPEFLSTHPNPGNRVTDINEKKVELNCTGEETFQQSYQDFKNSLP
ncbi:MAG: peptidase M48 [Chitinophagaceae bacterium]|nr:MAG: peptidase M48 [Chitinophagaceae bacterium]